MQSSVQTTGADTLERPCYECKNLQRLAKPHIVREDGAAAVRGRVAEKVFQPSKAGDLVVLQLNAGF